MVKRLLLLNGLAALSVVLYHSSAWGFISMFWWTDQYLRLAVPNFEQLGSPSYFGLRFIEQIVIFAIPAFLFVSGFFVAAATGRQKTTIEWSAIVARIKTLVIPFLIWSLLIMVARMLQGQDYTFRSFAVVLFTGRAEPPFYYVPVIIQLYLLSPFLVPLARSRWKLLLLCTGLVQMITVGSRYLTILNNPIADSAWLQFLSNNWLFFGYIFSFSLGIVVGFHLAAFKTWIIRNRHPLLIGAILLLIIGIWEWEFLLNASGEIWIDPKETLIDQVYSFAIIFSFLAFEKFTPPQADKLAYIGTRSYGIYLIHSPVLEVTSRLIYHLVPAVLAYQVLFQPILWVSGLGVPLLMMYLVNRSPLRRFYSILFG